MDKHAFSKKTQVARKGETGHLTKFQHRRQPEKLKLCREEKLPSNACVRAHPRVYERTANQTQGK